MTRYRALCDSATTLCRSCLSGEPGATWLIAGLACLATGISGLGLLFGSSIFGSFAAHSPAEPLRPREETIVLGHSLRQGQAYKTRFRLENVGHAPIHLLHFYTDCGCVVLTADKEVLPVGEVATVTATVQAGLNRGLIRQGGTLEYSCEGERWRRRCVFTIEGTVTPDFEISDTVVVFNRGERATKTVSFSPRFDTALDLRVAGVTARGIGAQRVAYEDGEAKQCIAVEYDPVAFEHIGGMHQVILETGSLVESTFRLDVLVR